jgi:hypothetical protein
MNRITLLAGLAMTLVTGAVAGIPVVYAAQPDPSVTRSLDVQAVEARRSRIYAVVGSVPMPQGVAAPSTAEHSQLRDAAVLEAKKTALERAATDLGSTATPSLDDVYIIQLTELPIENNQYKVLLKAEVRYTLTAAAAQSPAAPSEQASTPVQTSMPPTAQAGTNPADDAAKIMDQLRAEAANLPPSPTSPASPTEPVASVPDPKSAAGSTSALTTSPQSSTSQGAGDTSQPPSPPDSSAPAPVGNNPTVLGSLTTPDSGGSPPVGTSSTPVSGGCTSAGPPLPGADGRLTVKLCTDRTSYQDGEQMVVHVIGNRDFYGKIWYHDVAGKDIQILPNDFRKDAQFKANTEILVPGDADKFQLMVKAPFGSELITVIASTAPQGDVPLQPMANGLALVQAAPDEAARLTRSLAIMPRDPAAVASLGGAPLPSSQTAAPTPDSGDTYTANWSVTTLSK